MVDLKGLKFSKMHGIGNDFPIILIGNKIDLNERRIVSEEEGQKIATICNIVELTNHYK